MILKRRLLVKLLVDFRCLGYKRLFVTGNFKRKVIDRIDGIDPVAYDHGLDLLMQRLKIKVFYHADDICHPQRTVCTYANFSTQRILQIHCLYGGFIQNNIH